MRLRDHAAGKASPPVGIMTIGAGEVQLALPLFINLLSSRAEWFQTLVFTRRDRHAARLISNEGREREKLPTFERKRYSVLVDLPTDIDAALEINRPSALGEIDRIARGNALHAYGRIPMAL